MKEEEATSVNHFIFALLSWGTDVDNVPRSTRHKIESQKRKQDHCWSTFFQELKGSDAVHGDI